MQATDRISIRTTPHAKTVIEQASNMMGVSMSHFIITTMYEKSLQLINDTFNNEVSSEIWHATNEEKAIMQQLLAEHPNAKPNAELKALLALTDGLQDNT